MMLPTMPATLYVEGIATGTAVLDLVLKKQSTMTTIDTDSIRLTIMFADATAYRPQTEGPGYGAPFQKRAVPFAEEESRRSPISIATGGRVFLEENFVGSPKAEARAGAVVEEVFHPADLGMGDVAKVGSFGKVWTD